MHSLMLKIPSFDLSSNGLFLAAVAKLEVCSRIGETIFLSITEFREKTFACDKWTVYPLYFASRCVAIEVTHVGRVELFEGL